MSARRIFILPALFLLCLSGSSLALARPYVCMETSLGTMCLELFDDVAPKTVENFLTYVNGGDYNNTFVHRSIPGFVIQGGGYFFSDPQSAVAIPKDDPVVNEFNLSNLPGTIAMAKLPDNPDSATSEWFINLGNNAGNPFFLDSQNEGFTVFGRIVGNGMNVVDAIVSQNISNLTTTLGGAFTDVPTLRTDAALSADDLVTIFRAYQTDAENLPEEPAGIFTGTKFTVPLHYRGKLYRVIFDLISIPPSYVFRARTTQIVQLTDTGQEAAVYANNRIVIPTLLYKNILLTDLVFDLSNSETLEFTLVSYKKP